MAAEDNAVSRPNLFKYVLGELIGKGSYARVYLAMNANNGELMAVKRVETPQTASDRVDSRQLEVVEALKFESETLKYLEHPNIVQYLGFEETPETLNIFLEYVPGGTIGSCLSKHGKFNQEVTKWFTEQILAGLEYLHSTGILHRDLKGDNILVEPSGTCKISDFGISKKQDVQGQAHTQMKGTGFWMAPEVLDSNSKRGYDSKVDIWSVGCVVLEMWTGVRPWAGEEIIPVMMKLYNEKQPPPVPPDILAGLSDVALDFRRECFAMNPKARPPAAVLRQHAYLELPPGWVFQLSDIERSSARLSGLKRGQGSNRHRNSSAPAPRHRRSATTTTDAPPLPTARASDYLQPPSIDTSTLRPDGSHRRPPSRSRSRPPSNDPPPIVYITPPSSPVRTSSRNSMSPATSESTRTSGSLRPRKSFYVVNPDPEPSDQRRTEFVFNPPPLPAGEATLRPSPPQLLQRRSMADFKAEERRKSSMQQLAGRVGGSTSRQSTSRPSEYYSDSDSDSNAGTGLWKKPPVELQKTPLPNKQPSRQNRRSIIETKRQSTWAPRPGLQVVYSNLQGFFPRVDLDKPIISDRQRRTKSIRMVAELNRTNLDNSGLRRAATTKLWGHRVEEVTH
ncbi:kinase-like domain-containing protein [Mycena capillaripes]|nr:kinase-like domain-containing protein [Mycena capillaripes]